MAKPLTFYSHKYGPFPWKTAIVLNELDIPHNTIFLDFGNGENGVEGKDHLKRNPGGRVPFLYDPNTKISLAESNTINTYLVETYDKDQTLYIPEVPQRYLITQWLNFEAGTQGPIYQQTFQFATRGISKDGLAHLRAIVKRTLAALDSELEGKNYLVGNRCTIADLAFINWDLSLATSMEGDEDSGSSERRRVLFPNWAAWHERLVERPAVRKTLEYQRSILDEKTADMVGVPKYE